MTRHDDGTTPTDESNDVTDTETSVRDAAFGAAEVRIDVDEDTYQRLRERYDELVATADVSFSVFVENQTKAETVVTVDGERVE